MKKSVKYTLLAVFGLPFALFVVVAIYGAINYAINAPEIERKAREELVADSTRRAKQHFADSVKQEEQLALIKAEEKAKEDAFNKLPLSQRRKILQEREKAERIASRDASMIDAATSYVKERLSHYEDFSVVSTSGPDLKDGKFLLTIKYKYTWVWRAPKEMNRAEIITFDASGTRVLGSESVK